MGLCVKELLKIGERRLSESGIADSAIDVRLLYCFMMKITRTQLIMQYQNYLQDSLCDEFFRLLDIRCSGTPVQHIIGTQEFMGFEFNVNDKVLIPRQDTETLVEKAIEIINEKGIKDVLDLCAGSGAIGISLSKLCKNVNVTCSDISSEAIVVAKENGKKLGCSNKIKFVSGDLYSPFSGKIKNKRFDMIISNPPYIRSDVITTLQTEVKDHEPMMALDGGPDGLEFYRQIIAEASGFLTKEGVLIMEIGHDQMEAVHILLAETEAFENIVGMQDLAGRDRIVMGSLIDQKKRKKKK